MVEAAAVAVAVVSMRRGRETEDASSGRGSTAADSSGGCIFRPGFFVFLSGTANVVDEVDDVSFKATEEEEEGADEPMDFGANPSVEADAIAAVGGGGAVLEVASCDNDACWDWPQASLALGSM